MKTVAYKTDCCNEIRERNAVHGVIDTNDMFDIHKRFETVDPEKSNIHYCSECYITNTVEAAEHTVKRKNNEEKYQEKLRELTYVFKKSLFTRKEWMP